MRVRDNSVQWHYLWTWFSDAKVGDRYIYLISLQHSLKHGTGWPRSYRNHILQITQPSQYRYAKLQYRFAVTFWSPSRWCKQFVIWLFTDFLSGGPRNRLQLRQTVNFKRFHFSMLRIGQKMAHCTGIRNSAIGPILDTIKSIIAATWIEKENKTLKVDRIPKLETVSNAKSVKCPFNNA